MADFVRLLISGSEKAANIARMIRSEKELFDLLVEEKTDSKEGKNERFVHDFKTLADVLIQESLKHDISKVVRHSFSYTLYCAFLAVLIF